MNLQKGFTLIELMITVAILAILASVAVPIYSDYLVRSKIPDATSNLASKRVSLEQFFQDNRTYVGAPACAADAGSSQNFDFSCPVQTNTTYTLQAAGKGKMSGFTYTIDLTNTKTSSIVSPAPDGWVAANGACWITKAGGMLKVHDNQHGFTMVELLMGVAIIAILFSAGAPSFMTWMQNSQLRTSAESISSGLQLARTEAVRRNTNIRFALNGAANVDSGWSVGCVTTVADIDLDGADDCPAVIQSRASSEGTPNVVVSANSASVTFNGLGRASNATGNALTINITNPTGGECLQNNGSMRCLNIVVAPGGQIRMCNPAMSGSNPQGC